MNTNKVCFICGRWHGYTGVHGHQYPLQTELVKVWVKPLNQLTDIDVCTDCRPSLLRGEQLLLTEVSDYSMLIGLVTPPSVPQS